MATWKELHELDNLEDARSDLTERQEACIKLAHALDLPQFIIVKVGYDLDKAQELQDKLDCYTKVAEYIDVNNPDMSTESILQSAGALMQFKMEDMMSGITG